MDAFALWVEYADLYVEGFWATLRLTIAGGALAFVLGTVLAVLRVSPVAPLRAFGAAYVEVLRNTPLTLVFFFFLFVAPRLEIQFPFFLSAVVALGLYTAAFVCEALRSGVNSVGVGQAEAARSIGLTFGQTLGAVVIPQAFRTVIPPLINVYVALTKNTSIASAFFTTELTAVGLRISNDSARPIPALIGVALCYLVITIPLGILSGRLERRLVFAR